MEEKKDINALIGELVSYGMENSLVEPADEVYVTNQLLSLFGLNEYEKKGIPAQKRPVHEILDDMLDYAVEHKILEDDTVTARDLFDTKIMGLLTPLPSQVQRRFWEKYEESPKAASDDYYAFSQATNYIRRDRIAKDEKWVAETEYGPIDITINLSKPERTRGTSRRPDRRRRAAIPAVCFAGKMRDMRDILAIRPDRTTGLFRSG